MEENRKHLKSIQFHVETNLNTDEKGLFLIFQENSELATMIGQILGDDN